MAGNPGLLPADVLLKIFSYCSYKDLVQFQLVCRWWQQVSRDSNLWRDIVYKPDVREKPKDIIENLKKSSELRALHLTDIRCATVTKELAVEIVNACPRLEQLSVCWYCLYKKFHFKMETIKILILDKSDVNVGVQDYFEYIHAYFPIQDCFEHLHTYFPNVEHLDCSNIPFEVGKFLAYLRKRGQFLHTLGLNCRIFGFNKCSRFQKCILLDLSMCTKLSNLILAHECGYLPVVESADHLKQISFLRLQLSKWGDDYRCLSILRYFSNLVELELHECVRGDKLGCILGSDQALNCPLLEKLTLCKHFSDYSLKYVSRFKKLTSLCLRNNHLITDACVPHIQAILELRYLDISHCYQLTPQCLLALCRLPKLQTLKFDLLDKYIPTRLDASQVKNPDLHIMFYNCKDMRGLDNLRRQGFRISLLKGFMLCDSVYFCPRCSAEKAKLQQDWMNDYDYYYDYSSEDSD